MQIFMSKTVKVKLHSKHQVTEKEIFECFFNRTHTFLTDTREEHLTDPITNWFISETDLGRQLKICFVKRDEKIEIKTAYQPDNNKAIDMYYQKATEY